MIGYNLTSPKPLFEILCLGLGAHYASMPSCVTWQIRGIGSVPYEEFRISCLGHAKWIVLEVLAKSPVKPVKLLKTWNVDTMAN